MSQNIQPLSDYVSLDSLPKELQFLKVAISPLLNRLKVFDYNHQISTYSNASTIQIIIRAEEKIGFELPGTGLELTLNPNIDNSGVTHTDIPITLNIQHQSQGNLAPLSPTFFSGQLEDVFQILTNYFDLKESESLSRLLRLNYTDGNELITSLNTEFGSSILADLNTTVLTTTESQANEIINRVYADTTLTNQNIDINEIIYRLQLNDGSKSSDFENIKEYYKSNIDVSSFTKYILSLLIPKFQAIIDLNAGISFPRSILRPYKDMGGGVFELETDTNVKTTFIFDPGDFYFTSENGFGYDKAYSVSFPSLYPKAEIGKTGIKISFTHARLDLSKKTNIPEADNDGRPADFTGVFIDEATITLPDKLVPVQEQMQ